MRGSCRCLDFREQRGTRWRQFANPRAPVVAVDGTFNKISGGQPLQRTGRCRPIQRNIGSQSSLIGCTAHGQRRKQTILQRRYLKPAARFLKQRHVNLVQPPDQKPRSLRQRPWPALGGVATFFGSPQPPSPDVSELVT